MDQNCRTSAVLWMINKPPRPQQFYGWFWAQRATMSSKLRTLAVLWMVLGPDIFSITTKLLDLGSSVDGFGPNGKNRNRTAGPQQFYGWFWALWIECHQNCRPWQFYGWFWALTNFPLQQNWWTSAVLWMVLGPMAKITTELLDLSSFMDGFGPYGLSVIKTADLGRSMNGFGPNK